MNIETKSIQLSVASVKLDGKKITNAILDQIPRLGFCSALITDEAEYKQDVNITPVCRFSLATFLQSESRIFKFKAREHDLREGESMSEQLNCQSRMDAATTLYLPQITIPVLLNQ